ncbi:hypothetical protein QBC41DRAFT_311505 [Cercophora samala]|uniref:Uncharacterized protein n=1 Tax=Cercophora samala TaxID=330535 RepID=A0AA40DE14_9PEZI|nr:hypothetical protein QBC41DRAFT_311505 [Cercophora samala]
MSWGVCLKGRRGGIFRAGFLFFLRLPPFSGCYLVYWNTPPFFCYLTYISCFTMGGFCVGGMDRWDC